MTWRERRKLSYLMHDFDDYDLPHQVIEEPADKLVSRVVSFFEKGSELIYPAKSFFVAIVYARMLERYFTVPFYEALNLNDLLVEDPFYEPYHRGKTIYDGVLEKIPEDFLTLPSCKKTILYFREEFLLDGTDCESNEDV